MDALVLKLLTISIALAAEIAPYSSADPSKAIFYWADFYHVNRIELYETLWCESRFNPNAKGDYVNGIPTSFGIGQFHNPEKDWGFTREQALDPDFAVQKMAKAWSEGKQKRWSCYTKLYGH